MRRFKSAGHAQRFLAAFEPLRGHFRLSRHKLPAAEYRTQVMQRLESGDEGTGVQMAA